MPRARPKSWPPQRSTSAPLVEESDASGAASVSDLETTDDEDIATTQPGEELWRSKAKPTAPKPDLQKLPAEILETILYAVDPETFASLILVNRAWREASQTPALYAHHLSRCPPYRFHTASDPDSLTTENLEELKSKFAQEVKRNLFEAFMNPKKTTINLVSTTTTSASAAFPGGEAFDFSFSPNGHWTLALSSSRIYLLDTDSTDVSVKREFKVLRRPTGASILDDGSTLVVLTSRYVNIYDLAENRTKHKRSISLDSSPHALAVSPKGEVLAVACAGGVELHSLAPTAGEADRRSVRCDRVDKLSFSNDGTLLLGTTLNNQNPYTVVLTTSYCVDDYQDLPQSDFVRQMWTTQIIIPHSSRDCSHSALLSDRSDGDANWTFTFDRAFESFRAVRTDDLRNGMTYFTGPKRRRRSNFRSTYKFTPSTLPAPSLRGELVATGFFDKDVWIYSVPQGLDQPSLSHMDEPTSNASGPGTPVSGPRTPTRSLSRGEASSIRRLPRWEVLLDRYRNIFAKGRRVAEITGIKGLRWVEQDIKGGANFFQERLLVAAPGGVAGHADLGEEDGFATVDGGRLVILDFDRRHKQEEHVKEITIEVGSENADMLEEESIDIDTEVELARRRTRRDVRPMSTVAEALAPSNTDMPPLPSLPPTANAIANIRAASAVPPPGPAATLSPPIESSSRSESPGLNLEEASAAFDGPYSHTQPRSRQSLYRSATAVADHRQRNPPRLVQNAAVQYRRPDGRGELPHESDADNWVPPPPPYQPKPDVPLPEHLQRTLIPRQNEHAPPRPRPSNALRRPQRANTMYENLSSRHATSYAATSSQRSQQPTRQAPISARSVSESLDRLSGPANISPLSSDFAGSPDEGSHQTRHTTSASGRRPVSAYVGRMASSLRRRSHPRLRPDAAADTPDVPPVPTIPISSSLPPSPTRTSISPNSPDTPQDSPDRPDPSIPDIPSMPSAEQLAHLESRQRQPPPKPISRRPVPSALITSGDRIPAPPRGALGAAGSPSQQLVHGGSPSQRQSPSQRIERNSMQFGGNESSAPQTNRSGQASSTRRISHPSALSNPNAARSASSLPRPQAQRLDTIESIASNTSFRRTQSRGTRRSASVGAGPALRVDSMKLGGHQSKRKAFLGLVRKKAKDDGDAPGQGSDAIGLRGEKVEKDGKCQVM